MFWALDRLMRLARVVFSNHLYCGFGRRARLQDATTELLSDDFVRVRVQRPPHVQWSPGQTAYLIMPSVSAFPLEAHPFSISSIDSVLFQPSTRESETAQWKELVFLINVRSGFTKRLKDVAAQNQTVKLFIDGPYGSAPDMDTYDTAIFVAGELPSHYAHVAANLMLTDFFLCRRVRRDVHAACLPGCDRVSDFACLRLRRKKCVVIFSEPPARDQCVVVGWCLSGQYAMQVSTMRCDAQRAVNIDTPPSHARRSRPLGLGCALSCPRSHAALADGVDQDLCHARRTAFYNERE